MFAFPIGYYLSINKNKIKEIIDKNIVWLVSFLFTIEFLILIISQSKLVNNWPIVIINIISLFTVVPMAINLIVITWKVKFLLSNKLLRKLGLISFEIYLVHSFTLSIINKSIISITVFIVITYVLTLILNKVSKFLNKYRR